MRLIDAEALYKKVLGRPVTNVDGYGYINHIRVLEMIDNEPTVEAKPVVHAHWALFGKDGTDTDYGCTNCGYTFTTSGSYPQSVHYCPYCGAQMDEEINNG